MLRGRQSLAVQGRLARTGMAASMSIMFCTGDKFPKWKNNLFVGSLTEQKLIRIAFHQPSQAEPREGLLIPLQQRIRDVVQGPDGYIYVATEKASRGDVADGTVLRIEPAQ
jgi:aldose sugar dehydrogenase